MRFTRVFAASLLLVASTGCLRKDTDATGPGASAGIYAVWNPAVTPPKVPAPTDLAKKVDGGVGLAVPLTGVEGAQLELYQYLNTLNGWPNAATGEVLFARGLSTPQTAVVDPSTVTRDNVLVIDITATENNGGTPVLLSPVLATGTIGDRIEAAPTPAWPAGHTILIAIRGGPNGVKSSTGEPVYSDLAFNFLKWDRPVTITPDPGLGDTEDERNFNAGELERIRLGYQKYFTLLADKFQLPKSEVAVLWDFTIEQAGPSIVYDPLAALVPLPNNLLFDATGKLDIPITGADVDAGRAPTLRALNELRGFAASGQISFQTSKPVTQSQTILDRAIKVYELTPAGTLPAAVTPVAGLIPRVVGDGLTTGWPDDREGASRTVVMEPLDSAAVYNQRTPLKADTTYAVVVTDELVSAAGEQFEMPLFMRLLTFRNTFTKDGKSTVSVLDDANAQRVERVRAQVSPLLDELEARNIAPRSKVRLAFTFKTQPLLADLRALVETPYRVGLDSAVTQTEQFTGNFQAGLQGTGIGANPTWNGDTLINPLGGNTQKVSIGRLKTYDRLDPITRRFRTDGSGVPRDVNYALCIPSSANATTPLKVIIAVHEVTMSKDMAFGVCERFSTGGHATLAIDLPYHGARSVCVDSARDCAGGSTCGTDGVCRNSAGQATPLNNRPLDNTNQAWAQRRVQVVGEANQDAFLPGDLATIREHYQQAVIDIAALHRSLVVNQAGWRTATGFTLDGDQVRIFGYGLIGGIVGANYAAGEPRVRSVVLNATGGDFVALLQDTVETRAKIEPQLAALGISRGACAPPGNCPFANKGHFDFEFAGRTILDSGDPMSFVRYLKLEPYPSTDPVTQAARPATARNALVQFIDGDNAMAASASRLLGRLAGATTTSYAPVAGEAFNGHGAVFDPTPGAAQTRQTNMRNELVNFFNAN